MTVAKRAAAVVASDRARRRMTNEERAAQGLPLLGRPRNSQQQVQVVHVTPDTAENLVAVQEAPIADQAVTFLGRLLWFTISDMRVTHQQLREAFVLAGVDEKYLPKPISPRDAFRRATKEAEAKRLELPEQDGKYLNLLVREVTMNAKTITRQMVREVVDSKNVRLEYKPVAALVLEGEQLSTHKLTEDLYGPEIAALSKIIHDFEVSKSAYNGRNVRELVTKVLYDCRTVAVRPSGGVYFAPQEYEETVLALQRLVKSLGDYSATSEKSRMWSIPVIDAEDHREMLATSLDDQVASESKSLIDEMARLLRSERKITEATAKQYVDKTKGLREMIAKYEDMLQEQMTSAQANMEAALQQAMALMQKVEV